MTTEVTCVKLKDIKENDLLYIVIKNDNGKEAINVGVKTWERVNNILKPQNNETKQLAGKMDKQNNIR